MEDDFRLNSNNETVKVKINITKISKHVPILNIDELNGTCFKRSKLWKKI